MQIVDTKLRDAKIIIPDVHEDFRGFFKETFNKQYDFGHDWVQDGISYTIQRHTVRGMHTQTNGMAKLVQVLSGSVYDVIIDARKESATYGKHIGLVLSADNHKQLYVPEGFYHGFMSLTDNVVFQYKMSIEHNSLYEKALRYDSPAFNIIWPVFEPFIISEKDQNAIFLDSIEDF